MPDGQDYLWPGQRPLVSREPDTDLSAFLEGYITITPLRLDTTEDVLIPLLQNWTFP